MAFDVAVNFSGFFTPTAPDLGSMPWKPPAPVMTSLAQGTASGEADVIYADSRTIAASSSYSIDLTGTADLNVFNGSLALAKVKGIWIYALNTNTNSVVVGNGTNPFVGPFSAGTITLTIPPGGELLLTAPVGGWTVTAGTGDILKLANSSSGSGVDLRAIIWGTSA